LAYYEDHQFYEIPAIIVEEVEKGLAQRKEEEKAAKDKEEKAKEKLEDYAARRKRKDPECGVVSDQHNDFLYDAAEHDRTSMKKMKMFGVPLPLRLMH